MSPIKVAVAGCAGRMGRMLVEAVLADSTFALAAVSEAQKHPAIGQDVGQVLGKNLIGLTVSDDNRSLFTSADVVIDFTRPAVCLDLVKLAAESGKPMVIGTTGLTKTEDEYVRRAAVTIPIMKSANMSVGVNILLNLATTVASILGEEFDIEIIEAHHRHKADAPSGTALALGEAAARGRGITLDANATMSRQGMTGERQAGAIGFAVVRAGDVVGEHTMLFAADGERLELTHKASSRAIFVRGALRAAKWITGVAPGFYTMADVLGLLRPSRHRLG